MKCEIERQGDESVCRTCGLRWAIDEAKPRCVRDEPKELRIAKCIVGPRLEQWIGREKMLELRDHKWSKMVKQHERNDAINAARAIMKELEIE